jgi:hypothetical protein
MSSSQSTAVRCFRAGRAIAALSWLTALTPGAAHGQARDTLSDTWEATDGLGRTLPDSQVTGAPNQRAVLIFYYFWHQRNAAAAPYDISKIIAGKQQPFANAEFGPSPAFHHWGEPALGYYDINDEFVLRRHAQLLSDAGVDAIVLDVTNAATYDPTWKKLCSVYQDLRLAGNRTPAISFIANSSSDQTVQHLYDVLYSQHECDGLLYQYQGKPLIMAARGPMLSAAAKDFFTFRQSWAWTDPTGWFGDGKDKWPWLDDFPQKWGWHESAQVPEEMPVGVAQHPTSNYGRSHHAGKQPPLDASYNTADTARGLGFQEQWDHAIKSGPGLVFVTQWNEWIAQRFVKCGTYTTGATEFLGKPLGCGDTHFIDDFNEEFSRDVEPMRGGHEDAYYYQLVSNVRRYKGARALAEATPAKRIAPLAAASFDGVGPDYLDDVGDVTHRNALGFSGPQKYVNDSGRNDFELLRVARDAESLYFYAKTRTALSPSSDARWLVLWLDTDGNAQTGCGGFDYAVNRSRTGAQASVEHCTAEGAWQSVADADFSASGRDLVLAVPRAALGLPASGGALSFRFKWTDNVPEPLKALDLLELGDSAPNGRFTYRYRASVDIDPSAPGGGAANGGAGTTGGAPRGGDGGANATGGVAGSATSGGAVLTAGNAVSGSTGTSTSDAGCSCRVSDASRSASSRGAALVAALSLVLLRRRSVRGHER